MTVAAILKRKGSEVVTIAPNATLAEVAAALSARGVGLVAVLGPGGMLEGVISERDVMRLLAQHGPAALNMSVDETMTRNVITASPRTSVDQAMAIMTAGGFRHLPVVSNGMLLGIISIRDVVRAKVEIQETEVECLRAYVACDYVAVGASPVWSRA
jgi:CBS domain-containing protein